MPPTFNNVESESSKRHRCRENNAGFVEIRNWLYELPAICECWYAHCSCYRGRTDANLLDFDFPCPRSSRIFQNFVYELPTTHSLLPSSQRPPKPSLPLATAIVHRNPGQKVKPSSTSVRRPALFVRFIALRGHLPSVEFCQKLCTSAVNFLKN